MSLCVTADLELTRRWYGYVTGTQSHTRTRTRAYPSHLPVRVCVPMSFTNLGYNVPCSRLQASYARVHRPPVSAFGVRRIQRRVYNVPGYNSLCHHDGQHGMIPRVSSICPILSYA